MTSIRLDRIKKAQALMREQGWVGIMIMNHIGTFREIHQALDLPPDDGHLKVGMQPRFETPAFLADLFRKLNPRLELVPSDPVLDALRSI